MFELNTYCEIKFNGRIFYREIRICVFPYSTASFILPSAVESGEGRNILLLKSIKCRYRRNSAIRTFLSYFNVTTNRRSDYEAIIKCLRWIAINFVLFLSPLFFMAADKRQLKIHGIEIKSLKKKWKAFLI